VVFRRSALELPPELSKSPIGDYFLYAILLQHGLAHRLEDNMAVYRKGVGIFSGLSAMEMARSSMAMNACILAWLKDPAQKEILLERQMDEISLYHKLVVVSFSDPRFAAQGIDSRGMFRLLAYLLRRKLGMVRKAENARR
jgi:hypothetical protein